MTDQHLINVLIKFYLSPMWDTVYHGRHDVWCIQNGHFNDYMLFTMKTDEELERMKAYAKARAEAIKDSPLTKALK